MKNGNQFSDSTSVDIIVRAVTAQFQPVVAMRKWGPCVPDFIFSGEIRNAYFCMNLPIFEILATIF